MGTADAALHNGKFIHAKSVGDRKQVDLPQRIKLLELVFGSGNAEGALPRTHMTACIHPYR